MILELEWLRDDKGLDDYIILLGGYQLSTHIFKSQETGRVFLNRVGTPEFDTIEDAFEYARKLYGPINLSEEYESHEIDGLKSYGPASEVDIFIHYSVIDEAVIDLAVIGD